MSDSRADGQSGWPARAAGLAIAGALVGVAQSFLLRGAEVRGWTEGPTRISAAIFLVVGGLAFAFTIERARAAWSAVFAIAAGLLAASVSFWNGPWSYWSSDESWSFVCALLTVAIAAPFFQLSRDRGRWSTDYPDLHGHAWTNVVVWFAALAFTLIAYLLALLLAELFALIGIDALKTLLRKEWFGWLIAGGAFGAGVGLLRDNERIVRLLQRVVVTILSVLAPVLAAGLALFLIALPFTGLTPLWESTRSTTPILLTCVIGALILINAVIRDSGEEETRSAPLRWSGIALGAAVLPLTSIAAVSTGSRIAQHGMSPDRLWALVFVAALAAYGVGYLIAIVRRRSDWASAVRRANVQLALGTLALAAFLATPLADFGAISARDQMARLASGETKPEEFDFQALRFDFGPAGLRALERLARGGGSEDIRRLAREARAKRVREYGPRRPNETSLAARARTVRVRPTPAPLPTALRDAIFTGAFGQPACDGKGACILFWRPGDIAAIVVGETCHSNGACDVSTVFLQRNQSAWQQQHPFDTRRSLTGPEREAAEKAQKEALRRGEVEIRSVARRQIFIGGQPSGEVFE